MENIHLWQADRGTYYDRNVNIITWSDQYKVKVGRYCSIGRNCNFYLHANHRPDWVTTSSLLEGLVTPEIDAKLMELGHPSCKGDIVIGNDVWIGANSSIMSGVKIGNGAVVAAGSTVAKDVPPYAIVAGNPAKVIKSRFTQEQIADLLEIAWWTWPANFISENNLKFYSDKIDDFIEWAKDIKFPPLEIISSTNDETGCKIEILNNLTESVFIKVKFIDLDTGNSIYENSAELYPSLFYWAHSPGNWPNVEITVEQLDSNQILFKKKLLSQT